MLFFADLQPRFDLLPRSDLAMLGAVFFHAEEPSLHLHAKSAIAAVIVGKEKGRTNG